MIKNVQLIFCWIRAIIKKNDVISRHHTNHPDHQYAPAWKTVEYISFGDLIRLIDNLKDSDLKKKIYIMEYVSYLNEIPWLDKKL